MKEILLWSAIFVLTISLVGWSKWRYWLWLEEKAADR